jgi:hypothetical protein
MKQARFVTGFALMAVFAVLALQHCSDEPRKATLSPEEVEQICVHMVSCAHADNPDSTYSVSECIGELMWIDAAELGVIEVGDIVRCLTSAGSDCEQMWRCTNEGHAPEACDTSTYTDHCEGDMQLECSDGFIHYFDCSRYDGLYGDATCSEADGDPECVGTRTCDPSMLTSCRGTVLQVCIDGIQMNIDCALSGARCGEVMPDVYYCIGRGPDCTDEGAAWCEGSSVVRCMGQKEATMDCADVLGPDFTCVDGADGPECGPRATACDPETHVDTCSGTSISYCRWGSQDTVDCTRLDYSACTEATEAAFCE